MNESFSDLTSLRARMAGIGERLNGPWAETLRDHLHLDRGTSECAYWHSGYHQALSDILQVLTRAGATGDSAGTPSPSLAAG